MENDKKPSNPRMHNPDGVYSSEARLEDCVTLRDDFAAKALQGILSSQTEMRANGMDNASFAGQIENICNEAYEIADAMLKRREK